MDWIKLETLAALLAAAVTLGGCTKVTWAPGYSPDAAGEISGDAATEISGDATGEIATDVAGDGGAAVCLEPCDTNATCDATGPVATCVCNAGFSGDGVLCEDVDECEGDAACDSAAICLNTPGGFTCECPTGFVDTYGDGTLCDDIDECAGPEDVCDTNATCSNNVGGFECACNPGFSGDGFSCVALTDCSNNPDVCAAEASCEAQPDGSSVCVCATGYSGDGATCVNDDECADGTDNCAAEATCADSVGSFTCTCPESGFIDTNGDGTLCDNIDECATEVDDCDLNASCMDTHGGFTCTCNAGFAGDGFSCSGGPVVGALSPSEPGSFADGTYAESCQAYRYPDAPYQYSGAGDGYYAISPPGLSDAVTVFCDMTTDGGGWTGIDPAAASALGITMSDAGQGGCGFNGDNPEGHFPGTLNCSYDITTGFAFNVVRTDGVEFTSTAQGVDTTDVTFVDEDWTQPYCTGGSATGDVRFGTPAAPGPALSLGRALGETACGTFTSYAGGQMIGWPEEEAYTAEDTTLRLEFGEDGGQDEGYEWTAGRVFVRLETGISGGLEANDPSGWEDGTYAESCQAYRVPDDDLFVYGGAVGDGYYTILRPGFSAPVTVLCDMTTDGGGWTGLDPATAQAFGVTLTDGGGGGCTYNGDNPEGHTTAGLNCQYDIPTGFSFNTMRTSGVVFTSTAQGADTTDLGFSDLPWGTPFCAAQSTGDARFGTPAAAGPALSLGRASGLDACGTSTNHPNGALMPWPDEEAQTTEDKTLRLEFGESGGQNEGFEWTDGMVFVRLETPLVGALTQGDPGTFADGSLAASCNEYRNPQGWYAYFGVTGDGYYSVDYGAGPVTVLCDMSTDGGGWTQAVGWDRENDGDTLADFDARFTTLFNSMTQWDEKAGFIRWSDADSTRDAVAVEVAVPVPNGGEVRAQVHYAGDSMENSGVWFFAVAGGTDTNILCWDNTAIDTAYTAEHLAYVPGYTCPNDDPLISVVTWDWTRDEHVDTGAPVSAVRLHSLHSDCCVDGGDSSDLYYLNFWVR